jgi:hypothetical protein
MDLKKLKIFLIVYLSTFFLLNFISIYFELIRNEDIRYMYIFNIILVIIGIISVLIFIIEFKISKNKITKIIESNGLENNLIYFDVNNKPKKLPEFKKIANIRIKMKYVTLIFYITNIGILSNNYLEFGKYKKNIYVFYPWHFISSYSLKKVSKLLYFGESNILTINWKVYNTNKNNSTNYYFDTSDENNIIEEFTKNKIRYI